MTDTNDAVEALGMARQLIQEAKGADGPEGGFVTDSLDAAENWLDTVEAALSRPTQTADAVEAWINYRPGNDMVYAKEDAAIMRHAFMAGHQAALSHTNTSEGVEAWNEERALAELSLLYNHTDDDSRQFTRWQMIDAMHHGRRHASPPTPDTTHNAELVGKLVEKREQVAAAKRNLHGLPVLVTESDTQTGRSAMWMDNGLAGCGQVAISTGEFPCAQTDAIAALANVAANIDFDAILTALRTPDSDLLREARDAFDYIYEVTDDEHCGIRARVEASKINTALSRLSPAQKGGA
jgi:hypothetical protein